jgi:8-oxo-dGTP pyrophosphatase MutT (NUDIX family)
LLRDHADGLQVFLMKRHGLSDVLGGAYVFPGGKVDEADAQLDAAQYFDQDSSALPAALDEIELTPNQASALFVAALRESFEESGVLFAAQATGEQIQAATALHQEGLPFKQILQQLALRLQTQNIVPWSRWITPKMSSVSHKRFDTRFFIAALPANQTASSANHETTESIWLSPREALTSYWNKEISLAPPQIMSLVHLARHDSVASIMQQAKQTPVPLIEPQPYNMDGTRVICYPGDAQHPIPTRALPGPTRLCYRNNRFEPVDGFEALLKD